MSYYYRRSKYPYSRYKKSWSGKKYSKKKRKKIAIYRQKLSALVKGMEFKSLAMVTTAINPTTTPSITYMLPSIAIGTSFSNEIVGSKALLKYFSLRILVKNDHGTPIDTQFRMIVFLEKRNNPNAADPVANDILNAVTTYGVIAAYNTEYFKNYQILFDKIVSLDTTQHTNHVYSFRRKMNRTLTTDGTNPATKTNVTSCRVWMLLYGDQATSTNAPNITWNGRISFLDN